MLIPSVTPLKSWELCKELLQPQFLKLNSPTHGEVKCTARRGSGQFKLIYVGSKRTLNTSHVKEKSVKGLKQVP